MGYWYLLVVFVVFKPMGKIININDAAKISKQLKQQGKTIVLAGGCFDLIHSGHISFLDAAKKQGDLLFVLLESDENVRKIKGQRRPLNSQKNRSIVLSVLPSVDYIIPLKGVTKNNEYDKLIVQIKPDVIAMTKGEPGLKQRKRQASMVGAKVKLVIARVKEKSTTGLINKNG